MDRYCLRPALITALVASLAMVGWATPPTAQAAILDGCLITASTSDLNGDGFDDAAVGDPFATVDGQAEAGAVTVLFGDADGRIGEGSRRVITQADLGEMPEAGDHFGFDLELGRIDVDTLCAGILIGSPGEDVDGRADAGMAHVVSFATDAEGAAAEIASYNLTQADGAGLVEAGDAFGFAVAIMGITQEDPRRIVIGAPGETVGTIPNAGAVNVFRYQGGPSGLTELRQGRRMPYGKVRLPGEPQSGDRFGASLATGLLYLSRNEADVSAQGLVIGAPGDNVGGRDGAGSITVIEEEFESASLISQDSAGVPGVPEAGDGFGSSLALSPRLGRTPRTLAVGAPGEDRGTMADTGSVTLFTNKQSRFVARKVITQASKGVPGAAEAGDGFGTSLAFSDENRLLIGVPFEDLGAYVDAGGVQPVQVTTEEFPLQYLPMITEDATGTPGTVSADSRFGLCVGALFGIREDILTISSVFQGSGSVYVISDGHTRDIDGNSIDLPPRAWVAGEDGIPATGVERFGWAVSN